MNTTDEKTAATVEKMILSINVKDYMNAIHQFLYRRSILDAARQFEQVKHEIAKEMAQREKTKAEDEIFARETKARYWEDAIEEAAEAAKNLIRKADAIRDAGYPVNEKLVLEAARFLAM